VLLSVEVPAWFEPASLEHWPTRLVESSALHYSLPLRQGWDSAPQVSEAPLEIEHVFRGPAASDCLVIGFMDRADPAADIRNWVEAIITMTGFPLPSLQQVGGASPRLLEWETLGARPPLAQRLGVEEAYPYQGLAMLPGRPPELARFYILLARRETFAWKVSLSLYSACPPGTSEQIVVANDHVRAGATFGSLRFL
jgi:hypothetical protein